MKLSEQLYEYIIASDDLYELFYNRIELFRYNNILTDVASYRVGVELYNFLNQIKRNKKNINGLMFFLINNELEVNDCVKTVKLLNNFFFN